MSDAFLFAGAVVDIAAHDLPGLKAEFVVRHVDDGCVLADVGCGGGKMLRTIREHRRGVTLQGCDVTQPAHVGDDFAFSLIDTATGRLPYDDDSVDIALMIDVLEHVERPARALGEIARILRPDGKLLACVPIEGEPISWYSAFRAILGKDLYARTKDHIQAYTHAQVEQMLRAGFVVEERRYLYHFFGQLMDAALCAALSIGRVRDAFWTHSPYHGSDVKPSGSILGRVVASTFKAANAAAWAESRMLEKVRATSAGVLVVASPRPAPLTPAPSRLPGSTAA